MKRVLSGSGSDRNVILLGAGSEESIQRSEVSEQTPEIAGAGVAGISEALGVRAVSSEIHYMTYVGLHVTLSGRIMGNSKPFVDGRAAFILGDPEVITPCNENPDDASEEPWDACCDSPEDLKRGTATIQITDENGRVLKEPIEGIGGLKNLAKVTVSGTVAEGSSPDLLIVNASSIRAAR